MNNRNEIENYISPYRKMINSTPEILSLLYDIDLMPEQINSVSDAFKLARICDVFIQNKKKV